MKLEGAKRGDIVYVDKKGTFFFAFVIGKERDGVAIKPLNPKRHTWHKATSREVKALYRRSPRSALDPCDPGGAP